MREKGWAFHRPDQWLQKDLVWARVVLTQGTMRTCQCCVILYPPLRLSGGVKKSIPPDRRRCRGLINSKSLGVELDRYIGNTHHRGRLWDNRNHRQMMTIGDQSVPMLLTEF